MIGSAITNGEADTDTDHGPREYDAILIVGFGGPEKPEDVLPFLENVTRGKKVPRERLLEVAEHYHHFGGASPINGQVRALIDAVGPELRRHGITVPLYWGNRNWHPLLADTLRDMAGAGVKRALAVVLAAFSSYSSCRQYREDIEKAQDEVGPTAPQIDKIRAFFNHPEFVSANSDRIRQALAQFPSAERAGVNVVFSAHSIPLEMARASAYVKQFNECCRLVAALVGLPASRWSLVYQSRSGRPQDPWLEPDILDHIRALKAKGTGQVIIHPIGFLSDHMEVRYDLDLEAGDLCRELGLNMVRSRTVGTHPGFVRMLRELIAERVASTPADERRALGQFGPSHDTCPEDCCLPPLAETRPNAGG
jgi:ferrochelatase